MMDYAPGNWICQERDHCWLASAVASRYTLCLSRQQNTEQEYSCTGLPMCKESIDILDTTEGNVFEYNVTVYNWLADRLAS